jgi:hypothetical protein
LDIYGITENAMEVIKIKARKGNKILDSLEKYYIFLASNQQTHE